MALHHMTLKAALSKYSETTAEKLPAEIAADTNRYTPEEIDEIIAAISEAKLAPAPTPENSSPAAGTNQDLSLIGYDYNNLTGESFEKYMAMFSKLDGHKNRDFVQYMASGKFELQHDKNLNKVEVLVGITMNKVEPVNTTRIPVSMARDLNAQIYNRDNPPSNSRYYLLKK